MLCIRVDDPSFVESIRLRYFDQLITSKPVTNSEQIKIVNIDDETIRQKGQFPFPRDEYAKLIDSLYARNAGLVVFNVMMSEPDRFGKDNVLASVMNTQKSVVLPQVATTEKLKTIPPFRPGVSVIGGDPANTGVKYESIQPNISLFNNSAAGIGVVNTLPEIDGVTRRLPMVVNSGGNLYPSISLETLRVAAGDPTPHVVYSITRGKSSLIILFRLFKPHQNN